MKTAEFERRYQRDGDPWGYASSEYERAKYDATLDRLRPRPVRIRARARRLDRRVQRAAGRDAVTP